MEPREDEGVCEDCRITKYQTLKTLVLNTSMKDVKRKWDILTKEKREISIKEIISYFKIERNEEIGYIAAEKYTGFFSSNDRRGHF
jgi:hypothetical protein